MSSSSEDCVDEVKLQESIDPMFIPNKKFSDFKQKSKVHKIGSKRNKQTSPPEFRRCILQADNHMNLDITPGFQDFVSKYLFNLLENEIEEVNCKIKGPAINEDGNDGIKLFSASLSNYNLEATASEQNRKKQRCKSKDSSSESEEEDRKKIASVAVTYDWIVKQKNVNMIKNLELNTNDNNRSNTKSTKKNKCKKKKS